MIIATYTLRRHPRARRVSIRVHADGRVVLTVPRRVSVARAEGFLQAKADWVRERLAWWAKQPAPPTREERRGDYLAHRERARDIVLERVQYFARFYGVSIGRIAIRNQTSRWGSCSRAGNLNFNYRIALLPTDLADYVIVHEVCHRLELNHSPRFWRQVARTIPDYVERRKRLRAWTVGGPTLA